MALVLRNSSPIVAPRRPISLPRIRSQVVAQTFKWIALGWIGVNMLAWGPTVDSHGNCNCPLCHPFDFGHSE